MTNGVFIAMPVYRGADVIEETIRSILAQTHTDFHLVMSVDGADDPTIEICEKYAHDPQIDVVVQETRLGWPGNLNWLVENCDREFFCYWQQDDLASTGYLESLLRELLTRSDAAIAYTDVQWFGARFDRNGSPSIEGDPLSRVMQHVEAIRYEPLRGLMRASMLPKGTMPIPETVDESCQEEFVFLATMAAAGAFIRVDSAMYFKRLHDQNAFVRWQGFPDWRRRRGWISMGVGMYGVARALAPQELRPRILGQILDRLAIERHGRAFFHVPPQTPEDIHRFVRDFVSYARTPDQDLHISGLEPLERPIHPDVIKAMEREARSGADRTGWSRQFLESGSITIDLGESVGECVLGFGWNRPEPWGTWSDGQEATLRIPVPEGSAWHAVIEGTVYPPSRQTTIGYGVVGQAMAYLVADDTRTIEITVESGSLSENLVRFHLPDARAPADDRLSGDTRTLGFGLTRLTVDLP